MHQHASNRTRHGKRKAFEMKRGDWPARANGGGGRSGWWRAARRRRARTCGGGASRGERECVSMWSAVRRTWCWAAWTARSTARCTPQQPPRATRWIPVSALSYPIPYILILHTFVIPNYPIVGRKYIETSIQGQGNFKKYIFSIFLQTISEFIITFFC